MKGTKELKTNKGITLIALVITIIVMLILVAVTISMAVNGGLFEKAGEAVQKTNTALQQEQALSDGRIKVGELWYDTIDYYLQELPSEDQGDGKTFTYTDFTVTSANRAKVGYTGAEGEKLVIPKYFKDTDGKYYKVTKIDSYAFYQCANLVGLSLPDSITGIGGWAFCMCSNLEMTNFTIPNSVTSIGQAAFAGCSKITGTLTIPASVTSMNVEPFGGTNITKVILSEGITSLRYQAFPYMDSIKTINIPMTLTTIEESAFSGSNGITDIYYAGTEANWNAITIGGDNGSLTSATVHFGE